MKNKIISVLVSSVMVFASPVWAASAPAGAHKHHAVKHSSKHPKNVKHTLGDDTPKIDSNAYNFKSFVSSSVSPQTGQLNTSITLAHLSAHQLASDFTLKAQYSQGSSVNKFDMGQGWSLNLSYYDKSTNTLHLANGAAYAEGEPPQGASNSCVYQLPTGTQIPKGAPCQRQFFKYHQLQDVVFYTYEQSGSFSGAQAIYKDGHREIFDSVGRLSQIIDPRGFSVTLTYQNPDDEYLPSKIQDNFGDQITFQEGASYIVSTIDGQQHKVSLQGGSGSVNLTQVSEGDSSTGKYTTTFGYQAGTSLLQNITYPSGASDIITYDNNQGTSAGGLPVDSGGETQQLPIVTSLETKHQTPNEPPTLITYS